VPDRGQHFPCVNDQQRVLLCQFVEQDPGPNLAGVTCGNFHFFSSYGFSPSMFVSRRLSPRFARPKSAPSSHAAFWSRLLQDAPPISSTISAVLARIAASSPSLQIPLLSMPNDRSVLSSTIWVGVNWILSA